jgi:hypothetical protein
VGGRAAEKRAGPFAVEGEDARAGDLDRLAERFRPEGSTLVATNLTKSESDLLMEAFGSGRSAPPRATL